METARQRYERLSARDPAEHERILGQWREADQREAAKEDAERHRRAQAQEQGDRELYESGRGQGASEERDRSTRRARSRSSLAGSARYAGKNTRAVLTGTATSDGAGLVLGLIVYALGLNFIRGGWPAVTGWIGAKFINKPYTGSLAGVTPAAGGNAQGPSTTAGQTARGGAKAGGGFVA